MNVFKIAWRSIQHRGFGSLLTVLSMALGVMMVVAVLSIHGVVSQSFKNNNSFGYNVLVGARGGGLQLTLNTVYYLSAPVENVPYEYYLAFCDAETRQEELKNSIAYQAFSLEANSAEMLAPFAPGAAGLGAALSQQLIGHCIENQQRSSMSLEKSGLYKRYTHMAVPLCMGDYYVDPETGAGYRCVGTKPSFFSELVLDIESEEKFEFAEGRCFENLDREHGFFECVLGSVVAERTGLTIGSRINLTHGDPASASAHVHEETDFHVTGILEHTGTPHDRVVFVNMEGFFLIEGHDKPVEDERLLKTSEDDSKANNGDELDPLNVDPFADEEQADPTTENGSASTETESEGPAANDSKMLNYPELDVKTPLPIEQREVTSILVRTSLNDPYGMLGMYLPAQINEGDLESTLKWSAYRPVRAQKAAQAVNPIQQVTALFQLFVDPIRWLLLALTSLICVVSAISILVGIYNSMSQRQHEIAVMRALGAGRTKVMTVILCEAVMLALAGGLIGWIGGHVLNATLSPVVEARTGVSMGFFDFAPGIPLGYFIGEVNLPEWLLKLSISPELLLIPGLVVLAILVGIYPAVSAYRTDVSKSLGK
jgi:putative ABC transport system permease protein